MSLSSFCARLLLAATTLMTWPAKAELPWLPAGFKMPAPLVTERFVLQALRLRESALDHDLIASSVRHLDQEVFPGGQWAATMTPERAQIEAGYYQRQFEMARGFAYLVMDPTRQRALGRVYVWQSEKRGHDAMLNYFVRESELQSGLSAELDRALRDWLAREWPFKQVLHYRELGSAAYRALPNKQWVERTPENAKAAP